jgi:hypothetical protein
VERDAESADLHMRLMRAETHVMQLSARIAELELSTSWRLTRPLRRLSMLAGLLLGRRPTA